MFYNMQFDKTNKLKGTWQETPYRGFGV